MADNRSGQGDGNPPLDEEERLSAEKKLKLYRAAQIGDWETARHIYYHDYGEDFGVEISRVGDTALHIAAAAKRIDFVKELVKKMNENDLEKKNGNGKTALFLAATSGTVEIAKEIITKNQMVAIVPDNFGTLPIWMAAAFGHKDMVKFLYQQTKYFLKDGDLSKLFVTAIETDLYVKWALHNNTARRLDCAQDSKMKYYEFHDMDYVKILLPDVALQMLMEYPDLSIARAEDTGVTALHALAQKDLGAKYVEKKTLQARELVKLIWKRVTLLSHEEISGLIAYPRKLIFDAAERGNSIFLSILISEYPDLIWKFDNFDNNHSIFHYAVKYRQEDVFNLIFEIGSSTEMCFEPRDRDNNNILHLAAMLAPSGRLNIVQGAARQMQRELLWFKKVEKIVPSSYTEARNNEGLTPKELFTRQHNELRNEGERWMKDTAGSCMVVATLVTGVAFAAAITIPGGNNQDTGFPVFLEKVSFRIFAISDAISLVSSSASILNFLSVFISRYAEEDFRWSLLSKLNFGLLTLFISIAAMMVVFSTTFFIFFNDKSLWIAILVTGLALATIMGLFQQHARLFSDAYSAYVSDPL